MKNYKRAAAITGSPRKKNKSTVTTTVPSTTTAIHSVISNLNYTHHDSSDDDDDENSILNDGSEYEDMLNNECERLRAMLESKMSTSMNIPDEPEPISEALPHLSNRDHVKNKFLHDPYSKDVVRLQI